MDRVFRGAIQEGKIKLENAPRFHSLIASLAGEQIELILRKHKSRRSNSQNSWYWGCIVPLLAEHCGYDAEEMHEALKHKFLRIHDDSELPTVRSSAKLTTAEFTEYVEKCRRLGAELGVYIPNPGEVEIS